MTTNQYRDLPQIPRSIEDQVRHEPYGFFSKQHIGSDADCLLYPDEFDNAMASPQPVQRLLRDHGSFDPSVLYANIPLSSPHGTTYTQSWPLACYTRNVSPECASMSGLSSQLSHGEIQSPPMPYSDLYTNPADYSPALLSVESFYNDSYPPGSFVSHTLVDPREVEYSHEVHDQEPGVEERKDRYREQETGGDPGLGVAIKRKDTCVGGYCADSGTGQSGQDAKSGQLVDVPDDPASDSDYCPNPRPSNKRKRSSAAKSTSTRVSKRRTRRRVDSCTYTFSSSAKQRCRRTSSSSLLSSPKANTATEDWRPFPCPLAPYGCNSHFVSKNEWKRHVSTQHIKQGFWRCDLCPPTSRPKDGDAAFHHNDFNRIDLFRQHLRRMHAGLRAHPAGVPENNDHHPVNEANLAAHQTRCYHQLRAVPLQSACLFCTKTFCGPASWAERMDHVGLHLEREQGGSVNVNVLDPASWRVDLALERYLLEEGLVRREGGKWVIGDGRPIRDCSVDGGGEGGK